MPGARDLWASSTPLVSCVILKVSMYFSKAQVFFCESDLTVVMKLK